MDNFWTQGPKELLKSKEIQLKISLVKEHVKLKYEKDLKSVNPLKRLFIRLKIRREIKRN